MINYFKCPPTINFCSTNLAEFFLMEACLTGDCVATSLCTASLLVSADALPSELRHTILEDRNRLQIASATSTTAVQNCLMGSVYI